MRFLVFDIGLVFAAARELVRAAPAVIMICYGVYAHAGEWDTESDIRVGPGMKVVKAGDANVIVPHGAVPYQDDQGRIYEEPADEYAARGFLETDNRIKSTETDILDLKDRVKTLEDKLEETITKLEKLEEDVNEKGT